MWGSYRSQGNPGASSRDICLTWLYHGGTAEESLKTERSTPIREKEKTPLKILIEQDLMLPMRDGIKLTADVYRPLLLPVIEHKEG